MNFENVTLMDRTANAAAYVVLVAGIVLAAVAFVAQSL